MNPGTTRLVDEGRTASELANAGFGADAPMALVIDDDGMMRMLVRESLESGGFRVEEAEEGEIGMVLFESLRPETAELAAYLRREGCHLVQGYFFGRPVAAVDLTPLLGAGRAAPGAPHAGTTVKYRFADQDMAVFARA
jgi:hypothetical protein